MEFSEPERVNKDREPYRVQIIGKDGQVIEIVEQMGGGFTIRGMNGLSSKVHIMPMAFNAIFIRVEK